MSLLTRYLGPAAPAGDDLLPRKPAPPVTANAAARKRAQEVNEELERERVAAREAADAQRTREVQAREERGLETQRRRVAEWARERDRLRFELENAETASARCSEHAIDLSTPDAAMQSVQSMSLRLAAGELVARAEQAVESHERSR